VTAPRAGLRPALLTSSLVAFGRYARQCHAHRPLCLPEALGSRPTESRSDTADHGHGERLPLPPSAPNRLRLQARSDLVVCALARRAQSPPSDVVLDCSERLSRPPRRRGQPGRRCHRSPGLTMVVRVSRLHWLPRSARPLETAPAAWRPGGNERPHRLLLCDGTTTEPVNCRQRARD
jgi:hypothetical protein